MKGDRQRRGVERQGATAPAPHIVYVATALEPLLGATFFSGKNRPTISPYQPSNICHIEDLQRKKLGQLQLVSADLSPAAAGRGSGL